MKYNFNLNEWNPYKGFTLRESAMAALKIFLAKAKEGDTCCIYVKYEDQRADSIWYGGFHFTKETAEVYNNNELWFI